MRKACAHKSKLKKFQSDNASAQSTRRARGETIQSWGQISSNPNPNPKGDNKISMRLKHTTLRMSLWIYVALKLWTIDRSISFSPIFHTLKLMMAHRWCYQYSVCIATICWWKCSPVAIKWFSFAVEIYVRFVRPPKPASFCQWNKEPCSQ